jgi:negative regulator of sigma E activity
MCPNDQLLSAFFDGELPLSQQIKIDQHTKECAPCQERLLSFRTVKDYLLSAANVHREGHLHEVVALLNEAEEAHFQTPADKVWERLTVSVKENKQKQERKFYFWQKQVILPLPAIVLGGASFLFLLAFFILFSVEKLNSKSETGPITLKEIQFTTPIQAGVHGQAKDLKQWVDELEKDNLQQELLIKLPDATIFTQRTEPVLIQASRNSPQAVENYPAPYLKE